MSHAFQRKPCASSFASSFRAPRHLDDARWDFDKPHLRHRDWGFKDFDVPLADVYQKALEGRPAVAIDFRVLGGTPHIAGTRVPVFMILDAVEFYGTLEGALRSYPHLVIEQVKDAVSFAAAVMEHPVDYEVESSTR